MTEWQKTWAGAEQAFLSGQRYVLTAGKGGAKGMIFADGPIEVGFFPDRASAIEACEQHAGTNQCDEIPDWWDCSGDEPSRYVG